MPQGRKWEVFFQPKPLKFPKPHRNWKNLPNNKKGTKSKTQVLNANPPLFLGGFWGPRMSLLVKTNRQVFLVKIPKNASPRKAFTKDPINGLNLPKE